MYDIGNFLFGYFGEVVINDWFCQCLVFGDVFGQLLIDDCCEVQVLCLYDGEILFNVLCCKVCQDFCSFEGNVQGICLVYMLMCMNLIWVQVGCILKYICLVWWFEEMLVSYSYLMKKSGYYLVEEEYVVCLCKELDFVFYNWFLLIWIMEVVDDILYCVVDFEDVVEKCIFSVDQFYQYFYDVWGSYEKGLLFLQVVENVWEKL